jgi:hypothetical protein
MKTTVLFIFTLLTLAGLAEEKKIKIQKEPFQSSVTFEYNKVVILVDREQFEKFFQAAFDNETEPKNFTEALKLSRKPNAVLQIDSLMNFFGDFLEQEMDKGEVQMFYGARKIQANYIRREEITDPETKTTSRNYFIEAFKVHFYRRTIEATGSAK